MVVAEEIVGGIVGFIACLLCALPFWIMARFDKDSFTPINFWAGDTSLKEKVTNIPKYNAKMSRLYYGFGIAFAICGICCVISLVLGVVLVCLNSTVGLYVVYKRYKKILEEFS